MGAAATCVPSDDGELFREYGDYIRGLVIKLNVPIQEADDVVGYIVSRFVERNVLGMYNPEHISPHNGRPVTFRAFLSHHVSLYVRGQRDKLQRQATREHLTSDTGTDDGPLPLELFGGAWWDDHSDLDMAEFIARMRTYLALLPPRAPEDKCDLLALFDEIVAEVREQGELDRARLCARFGIAPATARHWLGKLQDALSEAPATTPALSWVVGGVKLTPADVKSAIEILEAAPGVMVKQPLAKAGHMLSTAEADWYHSFSREEKKLYPELRLDPATHKAPTGHVKLAVIHRFRRMLAEAAPELAPQAIGESSPPPVTAPAEPELPPDPMEQIEAELWALTRDVSKVDHILALVTQVQQA